MSPTPASPTALVPAGRSAPPFLPVTLPQTALAAKTPPRAQSTALGAQQTASTSITPAASSILRIAEWCGLRREARSARYTMGLAASGMKQQKRRLREVEVPDPSHQPNVEELRQDLRRKGTFEDAIKALVAPMRIRRVMPERRRR